LSSFRYPSATEKELADYSDDCAICRDSMSSAKVLPCGHIFHLFCIRSWLEHHSSCPTCRRSLLSELNSNGEPTDVAAEGPLRAEDQRSGTLSATDEGLRSGTDRSQRGSRRGSFASTPSPHSGTPSASTSSSATHHSFNGGHSTPLGNLASGSGHHSSNSGSNSNRSNTGHQLFAFNSEQQPWLTRLGFPRITVEVVDPTEEEDDQDTDRSMQRRTQLHNRSHEDSMRHSGYPPPSSSSSSSVHHYPSDDEFSDEDDEDLRRAIAESLAMSQAMQSQSTVSLPSTMMATSKTSETTASPSRSSTSSLRYITGATAFLRGASRRSSLEISSWPPSPDQHHQHQQQQQHHEDPTVMRRRRNHEDGNLSGCDLKVD